MLNRGPTVTAVVRQTINYWKHDDQKKNSLNIWHFVQQLYSYMYWKVDYNIQPFYEDTQYNKPMLLIGYDFSTFTSTYNSRKTHIFSQKKEYKAEEHNIRLLFSSLTLDDVPNIQDKETAPIISKEEPA